MPYLYVRIWFWKRNFTLEHPLVEVWGLVARRERSVTRRPQVLLCFEIRLVLERIISLKAEATFLSRFLSHWKYVLSRIWMKTSFVTSKPLVQGQLPRRHMKLCWPQTILRPEGEESTSQSVIGGSNGKNRFGGKRKHVFFYTAIRNPLRKSKLNRCS